MINLKEIKPGQIVYCISNTDSKKLILGEKYVVKEILDPNEGVLSVENPETLCFDYNFSIEPYQEPELTGEISDLFGSVKESTPLLFESFTSLETAPDNEPWVSLRKLAKSPQFGVRCMGIIANGAITNQKKEFLLSRTILIKILKDFQAEKRKEVSGKDYKRVLAQLTLPEIGFIKCLEPPSKFNSNERRAGRFEIIYPQILKYIKP